MSSPVVLADACSEIVDCAHKTAPVDLSGEFYAVGTPAMRGNVINYDEARPISHATFDEWTSRLRPRAGDLLLAREAPVGPVVRIPQSENVAPGQRTVLLRPNPAVVDPDFLYFYLISPAAQASLALKASGSTVPHLNVADVRLLPTPGIPRLSKQRMIAEVLGAFDDKIAANATTLAAAQSVMVAVVQRAMGRAPLGALAGHRTTALKPDAFDEQVVHYSLPAFDNGAMPERVPRDSVQSNKFALRGPSLLIAKLNPRIPRIWDVPVLANDMSVASTEFVVLEPIDCSTSALWAAVSQPEFSTQLQGKVAGTSGSHQRVRPAEILGVDVLDPRTLPAEDIALMGDLGLTVAHVVRESAQLAATRDQLLPLLMSGRITVRDAEEVFEAAT